MSEVCERFAVIVGCVSPDHRVWKGVLRRWASGTATSVQWDASWVIDRHLTHGDVIGFFHTHPPGVASTPSDVDVMTMTAWARALGRPLLAVIRSSHEMTCMVVDPTGAQRHAPSIRFTNGRIVVGRKEGSDAHWMYRMRSRHHHRR